MTEVTTEATHWEQDVMKTLAHDYIKEKRRRRRWGIFFKLLFFVWLLMVALALFPKKATIVDNRTAPHAALIDIKGTIFAKGDNRADNIAASLQQAYKDEGTKGIILRINSPGGSPVQADYIYREIIRLRHKHPQVKVYAVCVDVCASAAYYIAAATDTIYANPSSIVGSIGVLYNGFGFNNAMQKLGIERRLITAGKNKGFLDPFSASSAEQEATLKNMLQIVHQQFIESVKKGRGKRLKDNPNLFSGLFWTGLQAKQMGLIDDFGSAGSVARQVIKTNKIIDYTKKPNYFERMAKRFGSLMGHQLKTSLGITDSPIVEQAF